MFYNAIKLATLTFAFAVVAAAQTPAPTKIGLINSFAFADEKAGITKFVTATKTLNDSFKGTQTEITTMGSRLQTLTSEITSLQRAANPDQKLIQAKAEEGEKLQRDLKFKSEDAQTKYERQARTLLGPIQEAIGKGLQDYAKLKGYALIFDAAKDDKGLLIAVGDQSVDVTKDFIAFYNAKP